MTLFNDTPDEFDDYNDEYALTKEQLESRVNAYREFIHELGLEERPYSLHEIFVLQQAIQEALNS